MTIELKAVEGLPDFEAGDNPGEAIVRQLSEQNVSITADDVLVVAQKIVSKCEGQAIQLDSITPGKLAKGYAPRAGKDPRVVQVILDHSKRVIEMQAGVIISETKHGFVCANAGIDASNVEREEVVLPLPDDPDQSAFRIRRKIEEEAGHSPAVIISDTWGRPWREGQVNFAIGVSGMAPLRDYRGDVDTNGKELEETIIADADELASAGELVMGKTNKIPAVLIKGYEKISEEGDGSDLVRPRENDFFR